MAHPKRNKNWRSPIHAAWHFCPDLILGSVLLGLVLGVADTTAIAQITPDNTLGNERSLLTPNHVIEGGATRGANLFHSFSEFNVGEGQQVYFANPNGIQRILSRVTGNSRSQILGTLGVLGNADLFLINPNGILFGANAKLDLRGSLIATTADSILFDNGFAFSARNPQAPPLLTINVPLGLQYGGNAGGIQVQGASLQVSDGKTLALQGGSVEIDRAELLALGGRIELGGVTGTGTVELNSSGSNLLLRFPDNVARADQSITNGTFIDVRAGGGGDITIHAGNANILGGSVLRAGIASGQGLPDSKAGNIQINATGGVVVEGAGDITNDVSEAGVGMGGDLTITARSLSVINGAQLSASTSGRGNAGSLRIQTTDTVNFEGVGNDGLASSAFSTVDEEAVGNGGSINIITGSLSVTNGAQLNTRTNGRGDAGNVTIVARDRVVLDGRNPFGSFSGIFSRVNPDAIGQGGNISITAESLTLTNGAQLSASTSSQGNAGNVTITTRDSVSLDGEDDLGFPSGIFSRVNPSAIGQGGNISLSAESVNITNGAVLTANTRGQGDAGSIAIAARDRVSVNGVSQDGFPTTILSTVQPGAVGNGNSINITAGSLLVSDRAVISAETQGQGNAGSINVSVNTLEATGGGQLRTSTSGSNNAGDIALAVSDRITLAGKGSGLFANTEPNSTGNGGSIFIDPRIVTIQDAARISVDSQGAGIGGDIRIRADSLTLNNQAAISAETSSNQGGNITLDVPNLLLLRRGSSLSTTAGTAEAGGDGGNIAIAAGFIVAFPTEDSNIAADAFTGRGGNIDITTQGIFGIEFRDRQTSLSDITASSQFGVNGVVTINTPDIDPAQGAVELPTTFSTPSLARGCQARGSQTSSFVNTGRGGVPTNPADPLIGDTLWQDLELLGETEKGAREQPTTNHRRLRTDNPTSPIIEAQGWVVLSNGTIVLTAQPSAVTPYGIESQGRVLCE